MRHFVFVYITQNVIGYGRLSNQALSLLRSQLVLNRIAVSNSRIISFTTLFPLQNMLGISDTFVIECT